MLELVNTQKKWRLCKRMVVDYLQAVKTVFSAKAI